VTLFFAGIKKPFFLSLKRNQWFDYVIFLRLHHMKRALDLREGKPMGRERRGIDFSGLE
jgi:hypothetical protein